MDLRVTKVMLLSYSEQEITDENKGDFVQDAREENINDENNNRNSVWDNIW
jgi:phage terminase large subunit